VVSTITIAEYEANEKSTSWLNVTYGSFETEGQRAPLVGANNGLLTVPDFDSDSFQVSFGTEYVVYENDKGFSFAPSIGFTYIDASADGFTETGGPAALTVDGVDASSLLLDVRANFAYRPEDKNYSFFGHVGYQNDFEESRRDISARLASGASSFNSTAIGLGDKALTYSVGFQYDHNESFRTEFIYSGEARENSDSSHSLDLRFTYGF